MTHSRLGFSSRSHGPFTCLAVAAVLLAACGDDSSAGTDDAGHSMDAGAMIDSAMRDSSSSDAGADAPAPCEAGDMRTAVCGNCGLADGPVVAKSIDALLEEIATAMESGECVVGDIGVRLGDERHPLGRRLWG